MIKYFFSSILLAFSLFVSGQTLNLNYPAVEDAVRRAQLNGDYNPTSSFSIKPLYTHDLRLDTLSFLPKGITGKILMQSESGKSYMKLLPVQWNTEYNSHHPYGWNNGAMIRARGTQTLVSAGVFGKWGPITLQLMPEFIYAANKDFEGFPDTHTDQVWKQKYRIWNSADLPERFGDQGVAEILPGQSNLRATYKFLSAGISTENIWWGPGRNHSLIMTNNAQGFAHLTFNTIKPANTPIGSFEGQFIIGRLENSKHLSPLPERIDHTRWRTDKIDDWRYLNGLTFSYHPIWVPGLFIGFNRVVQNYNDSTAARNEYLSVFGNLFRKKDKNQFEDGSKDQVASVFLRWLWVDAKSDIYFEYGKSDASWNLRDLLMSPEHSRAYTIGFTKLFSIIPNSPENLQLAFETTHIELPKTGTLRAEPIWYRNAELRHGYTHRGEIIGSGIGPGSNVQNLSISWVKQLKKVGLQFERLVNDNDFYYKTFGIEEYKRNWTDVSIGLLGSWNWDHFLLDSRIQFIHSNNYQWEVYGDPDTPGNWRGRKENNLHMSTRMAYFF